LTVLVAGLAAACAAPVSPSSESTASAATNGDGSYPMDVTSIRAVDGAPIPGVGTRQALHVTGTYVGFTLLVVPVVKNVDQDGTFLNPIVTPHGPNGYDCTRQSDCQADLVRDDDGNLSLSVTSYHDEAAHEYVVLVPDHRFAIPVGHVDADGTVTFLDNVQLDVSYYEHPITDLFEGSPSGPRLAFTVN
jgi:hypothetical protein